VVNREAGRHYTAMQAPEKVYVESETVACDGGDGPLGHPRVYLNMEGKGHISCPYCGCDFILEENPATPARGSH
jgi:uncharacterized Zn-finger protein